MALSDLSGTQRQRLWSVHTALCACALQIADALSWACVRNSCCGGYRRPRMLNPQDGPGHGMCDVHVAPGGNMQEVLCYDYGLRLGCGAWTRAATARSPKGFLALTRLAAVLSWEALHIQSKTCANLSVGTCTPFGCLGLLQISVAPSLRARTGHRARQIDPAHAPAGRRASHIAGARSQAQNDLAHAPACRPRSMWLARCRRRKMTWRTRPRARRAFQVAGAK